MKRFWFIIGWLGVWAVAAYGQQLRWARDDIRYPYLWARWLMEDDTLRFWSAQPYYDQEIRKDLHRRPQAADSMWLPLLAPWEERTDHRQGKMPAVGPLWKDGVHFFRADRPALQGVINPMLWLGAGPEGTQQRLFVNLRGVQARGILDRRIGFQTELHEVQERLPAYLDSAFYVAYSNFSFGLLTQRGMVKTYDTNANPKYDYSTVRSSISFRITPHVMAEFGRGRHFIGVGYRSLWLSDLASDYTYLHLRTRIWRFQYHNLYTKFASGENLRRSPPYPKYAAFHYLLFQPAAWMEMAFFEGLIVKRDTGRQLDWDYLNPLIFYQSVTHDLGSAENLLLGIQFVVRPVRGMRLYHQLVLDEWNLYKLRQDWGWWGNKIGAQWGVLTRIPGLRFPHYVRVEYNVVRPYTYAHRSRSLTYTHLHQPLAHPLGANFREGIVELQFFPARGLQLALTGMVFQKGLDSAGYQMGGNVFRHYEMVLRAREYGNRVGQGIPYRGVHAVMTARWEVSPGIMLEARGGVRTEQKADGPTSRQPYGMLGVRWHAHRYENVW